jgi:hypothetical protein
MKWKRKQKMKMKNDMEKMKMKTNMKKDKKNRKWKRKWKGNDKKRKEKNKWKRQWKRKREKHEKEKEQHEKNAKKTKRVREKVPFDNFRGQLWRQRTKNSQNEKRKIRKERLREKAPFDNFRGQFWRQSPACHGISALSPLDAALTMRFAENTQRGTRLKCCACYAKWWWRSPKCRACHAKQGYTTFETSKSGNTPHRHSHSAIINHRTVANGCKRLQTEKQSSEHRSTPRPPK